MFYTGARGSESSRPQYYSFGRNNERRLYVRSGCRALEDDQGAQQDHYASSSTGDRVRVLHHRICQRKGLL